jgi:hypothetical protein
LIPHSQLVEWTSVHLASSKAIVFLAFLLPALLSAGTASDLARAVVDAGLDPGECYRVRDLTFAADRAKFFFADGYLILGRPINGRRVTAIFSTDVEGGDAEILLLPPNRAERQSLAGYTGSPNLDEHFTTAFLMFSPEILAQFTDQIQSNPGARKAPEMGALLDARFSPVARNVSSSFDVRLTWSLLSPASNRGFFAALISGKKLGNFDVVYDPLASEQVAVGATTFRDNRTFFDTWTNFSAQTGSVSPLPQIAVSDFRINATIHPDLSLEAVTRYRVRVDTASTAVPIEISNLMNITGASIDGKPVEVLQHDDLRSGLIRHRGSELALLNADAPLEPRRDHEIEIRHQGHVIIDAGNQVYYIASRASWYPGWGTTYTVFDLTFRVPRNLQIVLPGLPVSETLEGDERVVHHRIESPVRFAGFNLGVYDKTSVTRSGFTVDVYANHEFERALQPRPTIVMPSPAPSGLSRRPRVPPTMDQIEVVSPPMQNPAQRLQALASSIAGAMDYFTSLFGPPPLRRLEVTPLPGAFGQGFPGLIYISTMSYLSSQETGNAQKRIFFEELLHPHETAHQWWGNLVYAAGYHDEWITESLSNYSALLYLDKQHGGRKVSDTVLASYRDQLLAGDLESTGPIVQGRRLETALKPDAFRAITYGKGTWILHMLRARMGDAAFLKMLAALRQDYERKELTTEQFRQECAKFLPAGASDSKLQTFFDQWVYSTGIPQLKLTWTARPGRVTGTVIQSGVDEDFSVEVPIEIRVGTKAIRKLVHTDNAGAQFAFPTAGTATKVTLDPDNAILRKP